MFHVNTFRLGSSRAGRSMLLTAACLCCHFALPAFAASPARVIRNSVQTDHGHSAYDRPVVRNARSLEYDGGFFHFYPGRVMLRESVTQQPSAPSPRENSSEIHPGHSVVVASVAQPTIDPLFDDDADPLPGELPILVDDYFAAECGGGKGGKGGGWGHGKDLNWVCLCFPLPPDDNLSVHFGVHGFKDPLNFGLDNSFGFHEGFNFGFAMPWITSGIGWQFGLQGVHSNFAGAGIGFYDGTADARNQLFFTGGLFHRVDCGLQGGVVVDYMKDDWHYGIELTQLRGELSWLRGDCYEFGFFFHAGLGSDQSVSPLLAAAPGQGAVFTAKPTNVYAAFFRHHFDDYGYSFARVFLGLTGEREYIDAPADEASPIFGADMHVGLGEKWALETGFTFVAAEGRGLESAQQENWNVGFHLVWYPHGLRANTCRRYYRPLFNVANNGSFLIHARN